MANDASEYGELYESIEGIAIKDMKCDGAYGDRSGPTPIKKGDKCFAAVLLNSRSHPNYEAQKPANWMQDFVTPKQ